MLAEYGLLADTATRLIESREGDLHAAMAEAGFLMLPFGEADQGLGTDERDPELLTLFETFGRHAKVPQSLYEAVLGGTILSDATGWSGRNAALAGVMEGTTRVATALHEPEPRRDLMAPLARAQRTESGWTLSGTKTVVIGAASADLFLVSAEASGASGEESHPVLLAVEREAVEQRLRPYVLRDGQDAADLSLDGLEIGSGAELLAGPAARATLSRALDRSRRCLAAEGVGLIAHALDRTQRHTSEREQFGRPIGQFQVVQHRIADMASALAQAQAMVRQLQRGDPISGPAAPLATVAELALAACKSAIQLHGAMGMTEELPLGQALRRAMTLLLLL